MKTIKGREIPEDIRGVLYLCRYDYEGPSIKVLREMGFDNVGDAMMHYAEIPNPESQLATGETYEELCENLEELHQNMQDKKWLEELGDSL